MLSKRGGLIIGNIGVFFYVDGNDLWVIKLEENGKLRFKGREK